MSSNRNGRNAAGNKSTPSRGETAAMEQANIASGAVEAPVEDVAAGDVPSTAEVEQSTAPTLLGGLIEFTYKEDGKVYKPKLPEKLRQEALSALEATIPLYQEIQVAAKVQKDNTAIIEKSVRDLGIECEKVTMRDSGPDFDASCAMFLGVVRWAEKTCATNWEKQNKGKKFSISKMAQPWVAAVSAIKNGWDSKKGPPVDLLATTEDKDSTGKVTAVNPKYPTIASVRTRNNERRAETAVTPPGRQLFELATSTPRLFAALQALSAALNQMTESEHNTIAAEAIVKLAHDMIERKNAKVGPAVDDAKAAAMRGGSR